MHVSPNPNTCWLVGHLKPPLINISSPHPSSFPDSFSRVKVHRRPRRSNPAHSHLLVACCCSKRIARWPRHGKSSVETTRCQSRTFTRPLTHRSSHQPGPESEQAPCRRLEAHGRASFRLSERVPGPGLDRRSHKIARAVADFALLWGVRPPSSLSARDDEAGQ